MLIYYVECANFCICLMGSRPLVLFGLNFLPLCCLFQRWRKKEKKRIYVCFKKQVFRLRGLQNSISSIPVSFSYFQA